MRFILLRVTTLLFVVVLVAGTAMDSHAATPEDYASYEPQTRCVKQPKPGTVALGEWLAARGGTLGAYLRGCRVGGASEHKDGRAVDWMLDAKVPAERALAEAVLDELWAPDETGAPHALARGMGIMYVIWNDRMYAAYDRFEPQPYRSSSCRPTRGLRGCSVTLRHRDHVHISLSKAGANARTSWYAQR